MNQTKTFIMNPSEQSLNLSEQILRDEVLYLHSIHEQKLRDEVLYLHSLWHQGPPTLNPNHHPPTTLLHVSNPKPFKRSERKKTRKPKSNNDNLTIFSGPPGSDPGPEWPVNSPSRSPAHTTSGWPAFKANSGSSTRPISDMEIADMSKKQLQQKFVNACSEFFTKMDGSDDDEGDELVEEDGDEVHFTDDEGDDDVAQSEEFKLLFNLFVESEELRKFYENEADGGEFYCLVCSGVGERLGKKYKGCLSLVQHAIAISKTRRRRAHRAFGHVICRVLGWEFDRLPVVVIKNECLSRSLLNSQNFLDKDNQEVNKDLENGENYIVATQQGGNKEEAIDCLSVVTGSDAQWSTPEPLDKLPATTSSWPPFVPQSTSMRCPVTPEESAKFTMAQLQLKFVEDCQKFLADPSGSNSDEDEDGDQDGLNDDEEIEKCEEFKSFLKLFSENNELRNFYESHHEGGEFCCLVCCAIGKKVWKRFKGCVGLLQHVMTITRTKRKRAHRAMGLVICKVLSWDVTQFQTIVLKEPLGQSLTDAGILQDEQTKDNIHDKEDLFSAEDNTESVSGEVK